MDLALNTEFCDSLFDGLYQVDTERRIVFWNQSAVRITGYAKTEVIGSCCQDGILQHVNERGETLCQGNCPLAKSLLDGQYRESQVFLRHKQGHRVPVDIRIVPLRDAAGIVTGAAEIFKPAQYGQEGHAGKLRELAKMAFVDSLTGLNNRQYCELKLREKLTTNLIYAGRGFGVLKIEITNFKEINDEYGEEIGNLALQVAGKTLQANIEADEVAGRWYGGQFIIITSADHKSTLLNWATKLKALVEQSVIPDYGEISLKANVAGIGQHGEGTADRLLRSLDGQLRKSRLAANRVSIED